MASFTDNFNRSNESVLASPWSVHSDYSTISLVSNGAEFGGVYPRAFAVIGQTDTTDCFAQVTFTGVSSGTEWGGPSPVICHDNDSNNGAGYWMESVWWAGGYAALFRNETQVATSSTRPEYGDVLRIQRLGNVIEWFINGVSQGTYTDSSPLTTRYVGITGGSTVRLDNFSGGDLQPSGSSGDISFVAANDSWSLSSSEPTGTAEGDIVLAIASVEADDGSGVYDPADGFTLVTQQIRTARGGIGLGLAWARRGSSAVATNHDWSGAAGAKRVVTVAYRGAKETGNPINAFVYADGINYPAGNSLTTTVDGCLIACAHVMYNFSTSITADYANERNDGDSQWFGDDGHQTDAGLTGFVAVRAGGSDWLQVMFALEPGGGGGPVTLTPADSESGSTTDTTTLTQVHAIAPVDSAAGSTSDIPTVTQNSSVTPADSEAGSTTDATTIAQVHAVAPADSEAGSTSDTTTIAQLHVVTPDDSAAGSTTDTTSIAVTGDITPADSEAGSTTDTTTLTQVHVVTPVDSEAGSSTDTTTVTVAAIDLTPADSAVGSTTDATSVVLLQPLPFTDTWTGTNGDPWNTTKWSVMRWDESATPWWPIPGTIQSNRGQLSTTDIEQATALVEPVADIDLTIEFGMPTLANSYWELHYRVQDPAQIGETGYDTDHYYVEFTLQPGAFSSYVRFRYMDSEGTWYGLFSDFAADLYDTDRHWLRVLVVGNRHRGKVWDDGSAEPGTWMWDVTDTSQPAAGGIALHHFGAATQFDNLSIIASVDEVAPADSASGSTTDTTTLTQVHAIAPDDSAAGSTSDTTTISQVHVVTPDDSAAGSTTDTTTLAQLHLITPDDSAASSTTDSPAVAETGALVPADSEVNSTTDIATLTQLHVVTPDDSASASSADTATVEQLHVIAPLNSAAGSTSDITTITQLHVVTPLDSASASTTDTATITATSSIAPLDSAVGSTTDTTAVTIISTEVGGVILDLSVSGKVAINLSSSGARVLGLAATSVMVGDLRITAPGFEARRLTVTGQRTFGLTATGSTTLGLTDDAQTLLLAGVSADLGLVGPH